MVGDSRHLSRGEVEIRSTVEAIDADRFKMFDRDEVPLMPRDVQPRAQQATNDDIVGNDERRPVIERGDERLQTRMHVLGVFAAGKASVFVAGPGRKKFGVLGAQLIEAESFGEPVIDFVEPGIDFDEAGGG